MRRHAIRLFTVSGLTAILVGLVGVGPAQAADPTITSFTPTSGPVGTTVTITGTNFNDPPVNLVEFNNHDASFTVVNDTTIRATVPNDATDGRIEVHNIDGTATSSSNFNVTSSGGGSGGPTITSFNPTSGPVGTSVTINGSNFTGATSVTFNNVAASFNVNNASRITAQVPNGATDGRIRVTTPQGTATSSSNFNVTSSGGGSGGPTITSFNPTSGPVGTSVTIRGTHFQTPVVTDVEFDGHNAASFRIVNDTTITAVVPNNATDGPIRVRNTGGTATSSTNFNVTQAPRPTITSFSPTGGPIGTSVVIRGTNFSGTGFTTSAVRFNGATATFKVNSAAQITATVPAAATTGRISVTTPGGTAQSANSFTVQKIHTRIVTLNLIGHLTARGTVTVTDGFAACESGVSVKLQKRRLGGGWRTVRTTTTDALGGYVVGLPDRPGLYRAVAPRAGTQADVCSKDRSPRRRHRH